MIVPRKLYLMIWCLAGFILALLCLVVNGSESAGDLQWLPCEFVDENVYLNEEKHIETQYIYKKAILQFGYDGDRPLYPNITFLVTGSRVHMRHYLEGDKDTLHCIIRRYNVGRIVMRWPAVGSQEYDIFFTCTLHHTKGAFNITTFLRHTPSPPAGGKVDFLQRLKIHDKDLLTTSENLSAHEDITATSWKLTTHGRLLLSSPSHPADTKIRFSSEENAVKYVSRSHGLHRFYTGCEGHHDFLG